MELGGRPLSGQFQSQLAAISGSLAGGVSGAGEQTPVGVTQALGCGWGCARVRRCAYGHGEGVRV